MTRWLVVELEGGLAESRYVGLFHALRLHVGVRSVCDLSAITQETLSTVLMQPEPEPIEAEPAQVEQLAFV